jgi:hypothetical protein
MKKLLIVLVVLINTLQADIIDDTIRYWIVDQDYKNSSAYKSIKNIVDDTKTSYEYYKDKNPYRAVAIESLVETGAIVVGIVGVFEIGTANGLTYVIKNYKTLTPVELKPIRRMSPYEKNLQNDGQPVKINNVRVVQRNQLFKRTPENLDRMRNGKPPIGSDNEPVQLHHMKQQNQGTIVEVLAKDEHKKEYKTLHRYTDETEIDRGKFNAFRAAYWKERAKQ